MVKALLQEGADYAAKDLEGMDAFHHAAAQNHHDTASLLQAALREGDDYDKHSAGAESNRKRMARLLHDKLQEEM